MRLAALRRVHLIRARLLRTCRRWVLMLFLRCRRKTMRLDRGVVLLRVVIVLIRLSILWMVVVLRRALMLIRG